MADTYQRIAALPVSDDVAEYAHPVRQGCRVTVWRLDVGLRTVLLGASQTEGVHRLPGSAHPPLSLNSTYQLYSTTPEFQIVNDRSPLSRRLLPVVSAIEVMGQTTEKADAAAAEGQHKSATPFLKYLVL